MHLSAGRQPAVFYDEFHELIKSRFVCKKGKYMKNFFVCFFSRNYFIGDENLIYGDFGSRLL